jgi:glycogen operon protein
MDGPSWTDPFARVVGLLLAEIGTRILILVNAYHETVPFKLPQAEGVAAWTVRIDSGSGAIDPPDRRHAPEHEIDLEGRTLLMLVGEPG